ncbi:MAG TPA: hypothetical protein VJN02_08115 [Gammaproteobacteria bacterium]|nr:hypothetical protein [Gammaproteobacteria bacterium]
MLKHSIVLIALSILIIFFTTYAQQGMQWLLTAHDWVSNALTNVFSGGQAGNMVRELLVLLCIPVAVGLLPAVIYWVVRRHWFPYFMEVVWIVWLIQVGALLTMSKTVTTLASSFQIQ